MAQSFDTRADRAYSQRPVLPRPRWERAVSDLLGGAVARVQLIGRATPTNLASELAALAACFDAGAPRLPNFCYAPAPPASALIAALDGAATKLDGEGPLGQLYAARARELGLELEMCARVGEPEYFALARKRFAARDEFDAAADQLAATWLSSADEVLDEDMGADVVSDDESDARSLLSRTREEVGRRRLPFRVVVSPQLSALAATGASVLYIASGRTLRVADVERTVLHEIEGHALPRSRARHARLGIFRIGTAHGSDDQEGRALGIERRAGMLLGRRQRELARRHHAGRSVEAGADFVQTVRSLLDAEAPLPCALRIAARAHRAGGLARELVYLPAMLRVAATLERDPGVDELLGAGQIAATAAATLRPWSV